MEAEKNSEKSLDSWATSHPSFSNFGEGCEVLFSKKFISDFAQLRREITATNTIFRLFFLQCFSVGILTQHVGNSTHFVKQQALHCVILREMTQNRSCSDVVVLHVMAQTGYQ